MQQHVHPGQRVLDPEPAGHQLRDPGQGPALVLIPAPHGRPRIQSRLQLGQLSRGELAFNAAGSLGGQGLPAAGRQRPPPPVRRHPRHPEPPGDLPVAGPRLDQLRRLQPHPLPPGPLRGGQPAAIGIPHDTGIPRSASHYQRP